MRKWVALAAVGGLGALALWLALRPAPGARPIAKIVDARPDAGPAARARARALLQLFVPAAPKGALSGKVVGQGAAGASVALSGPAGARTASADAEGGFRFVALPPGDYRLDASSGEAAAETLGPIPLGAGEQLDGLVLQLAAASALSGQVLDAQKRTPLAKAVLSAGGARAVTDETGAFTLRGLPQGPAPLTVACPGYVTSTSTIAVPRGKGQTGALLLLTRAAHVAGHVQQSDGTPVASASVFAERYDFGPVGQPTVLGTTQADGSFEGDLPPGRTTLRATAPNGEARSDELDLHPGDSRTGLTLVVDIGGDIEGQVLDTEGAPETGASVFAVEIESQRASSGVVSGAGGHFQLSGLPAGVYAVVARSGARAAQVAGLRLGPGETVHAVVKFGAASLDGQVVDAAGTPLVGAQVSASPEGAANIAASGMESGAEGHFHFEGLAGERFTLRATHPSGTAELHGIAAGATGVALRIAAQSALVGTVFGDDGHAVTDFRVVADPESPHAGTARASGHFASASGSFHLACAPGSYRLRVAAEGYATTDVGSVEAPSSGTSAEIRVTLRRTRTIEGTVVDAHSHQPIAGAVVASRPNLLYAFGRANPMHLGGFTTTGPTGHFALDDAEPGEVTLFATAEGHGWAPPQKVPASSSGPVQLALPPSGRGGPEDFAGVGMQIGPNLTVGQVFDSGPADLAGLRNGDQLVSVDGRPVAGHSLQEVVGWIRGEVGTPVAVEVSRGGQQLTLTPTRAEIKF